MTVEAHDGELNDVCEALKDQINIMSRTMIPGTVVGFRRIKNRPVADIRVGTLIVWADRTSSEKIIRNVPVQNFCAGGITIQVDLEKGDEVWISCADRDISTWIESGEAHKPATGRIKDFSDAVCIPNLQSNKNLPTAVPGKRTIYIGSKDGSTTFMKLSVLNDDITFEANSVKIGKGATLGAARISDTVAVDANMATWITAVSLATGAPAPSDFGLISSGSSKVDIE